ncbi:galactokinase [Cellvibrio sp. QJXJ]|uniref:galactokinase n=1 Tax=Cellvibrio sp. QJXJ TaxID=2964606 RepID=UPI0021C4073E|nr:galactokinase [Cellvibrio sp. QJXJ]UUA73828.1 galactokinase [Cellvibrio sp. QJXJ]
MSMLENVTQCFTEHFDQLPDFVSKAPGRVNLIGEHTDYNDGFVLPAAIDFFTLVATSVRQDNLIKVIALDYTGQSDEFALNSLYEAHPIQMWSNYVRAVVRTLVDRGYQLKGCNLVVSGNVPQGAGLSSSASLEVALAQALLTVAGIQIPATELALIGQAAENNYVGCACGIMDQLVSAGGQEGHALLIDCRSLETTPILMPSQLSIVIINSGVKRGLVDSEYNLRREQCAEAAKFFNQSVLRDVTNEQFFAAADQLPELVRKRAQHVIEENERTLKAAEALETNNVALLSQLMAESHVSMRDLFEITTPEIDYLVAALDKELGSDGGVRMTGGGFGGCIVALVPQQKLSIVEPILADYQLKTGLIATPFICTPEQGASLVALES